MGRLIVRKQFLFFIFYFLNDVFRKHILVFTCFFKKLFLKIIIIIKNKELYIKLF